MTRDWKNGTVRFEKAFRKSFYKMIPYREDWGRSKSDIEKPCNHVWSDDLEVTEIQRGRSSAKFVLKSKIDDWVYYMFMVDMLSAIKNNMLRNGCIHGQFTFSKRGTDYGVQVILKEET